MYIYFLFLHIFWVIEEGEENKIHQIFEQREINVHTGIKHSELGFTYPQWNHTAAEMLVFNKLKLYSGLNLIQMFESKLVFTGKWNYRKVKTSAAAGELWKPAEGRSKLE